MENMLCSCEHCLRVYIRGLHKQIKELQLENKTLKDMILSDTSIVVPENTTIHIDIDTNSSSQHIR